MMKVWMKKMVAILLVCAFILVLLHIALTPTILVVESGGDRRDMKVIQPFHRDISYDAQVIACGPRANASRTKAIAITEQAELCEYSLTGNQSGEEPHIIAAIGKVRDSFDIFRYLRYGASDREVSYIRNDQLYVYDLDRAEESLIREFTEGTDASYTWLDASRLVYRDGSQLVVYDLNEKSETVWLSLDLCEDTSQVYWHHQQSFDISLPQRMLAYIDSGGNLHKAYFAEDGQLASDQIIAEWNGMYPIRFHLLDGTIVFTVSDHKEPSLFINMYYRVYLHQFGMNRRIYRSKGHTSLATISIA